jgi:hypothetical protein
VTLAVSVVLCPTFIGLRLELRVVVVLPPATTDWLRVDEVAAELFASPEYTAVRLCVPVLEKLAL